MNRYRIWIWLLVGVLIPTAAHALSRYHDTATTSQESPVFSASLERKLDDWSKAAQAAKEQGKTRRRADQPKYALFPFSGAISVCIFSACALSGCSASGCAGSGCGGSGCLGSGCLGSVCGGSGCGGSACGGSGCGGSVCVGSGCKGSVCVGSGCNGSVCVGRCNTSSSPSPSPSASPAASTAEDEGPTAHI
jgi:hypothetical protein